jgi:hypothetical protein
MPTYLSRVGDTPVSVHYHLTPKGKVVVDQIIGKNYGNVLRMQTSQGSSLGELKEKFAIMIELKVEKEDAQQVRQPVPSV